MSVTLEDACRALTERKLAIEQPRDEMDLGFTISEDKARLLLVGTGITSEEMAEALDSIVRQTLISLITGITSITPVMAGLWTDGLLTGQLLERLRHEEEARA